MDPESPYPVIDLMKDQKSICSKGGTMRLGAYPCKLTEGSKVHGILNTGMISERHRHRFEFNNKYLDDFENAGMMASGINPKDNLVEIIELKDHPWFVGIQFHPEYKSTVANPHPLFVSFVDACVKHK